MAQTNPPPSIPRVLDEAGDSPRWVPALGFGLFLLIVGLATVSFTRQPASPPPAAEEPAS